LALAEAFVAEGMRVVLADIDEPRLRKVEARLGESGSDVAPTVGDTSSEAAVAVPARSSSDPALLSSRGDRRPGGARSPSMSCTSPP